MKDTLIIKFAVRQPTEGETPKCNQINNLLAKSKICWFEYMDARKYAAPI